MTHGVWPQVVMHSCDVPLCCNPSHLVGGTYADNNRDMAAKGRHAIHVNEAHRERNNTRLRAMAQAASRKRWGH